MAAPERKTNMDFFQEWLNKENESEWIRRALTDPSFNDYRKRGVTKKDPRFEKLNKDLRTNTDLALLGDSIIKFIYSDYLLDKAEKLTKEKEKLESDERLVEIAEHYQLIQRIKKDSENKDLPDDYDYNNTPGKNKNRHKYIATCVEAIIGAIYKEKVAFSKIKALVISWISL